MHKIYIILIIMLLIFHFNGKAQLANYPWLKIVNPVFVKPEISDNTAIPYEIYKINYDSIINIVIKEVDKHFENKIKDLTEANEILKMISESQKDVFKIQLLTYSGLIDICFDRYISRRKIYNCISEININK